MCLQDWRLGKWIRTASRGLLISAGNPATLPANPNRVGLRFGLGGTAPFALTNCFGFVNGVATGALSAFNPWIEVFITTHGDMPTREWTFSTSDVGASNVLIHEWFLPTEILQSGLEEWIRQNPWAKGFA